MELIVLSDIVTGIKEIDDQHKEICLKANNIKENMSKKDAMEAIQFIATFFKTHTQTEEMYMEKFDYPDLEEHKKVHKDMHAKFQRILLDMANSSAEAVIPQIKGLLLDYIRNHLTTTDLKMALFFQRHLSQLQED